MKRISLNLIDFLDLVLGSHDWAFVPDYIATSIELGIDKDEELCHIEWPSELNTANQPQLWHKKPWMNHYARVAHLRAKCAEERQIRLDHAHVLDTICVQLQGKIGLDSNMAKALALQLMLKKKSIIIKEMTGIDISELKPMPSTTNVHQDILKKVGMKL